MLVLFALRHPQPTITSGLHVGIWSYAGSVIGSRLRF